MSKSKNQAVRNEVPEEWREKVCWSERVLETETDMAAKKERAHRRVTSSCRRSAFPQLVIVPIAKLIKQLDEAEKFDTDRQCQFERCLTWAIDSHIMAQEVENMTDDDKTALAKLLSRRIKYHLNIVLTRRYLWEPLIRDIMYILYQMEWDSLEVLASETHQTLLQQLDEAIRKDQEIQNINYSLEVEEALRKGLSLHRIRILGVNQNHQYYKKQGKEALTEGKISKACRNFETAIDILLLSIETHVDKSPITTQKELCHLYSYVFRCKREIALFNYSPRLMTEARSDIHFIIKATKLSDKDRLLIKLNQHIQDAFQFCTNAKNRIRTNVEKRSEDNHLQRPE